jgi:hypothetical protein
MNKQLQMIPVLPSNDIERDIKWYEQSVGFKYAFGDKHYCGLTRDNLEIHLQLHRGTEEDPMLDGSVIKIFVPDLKPYMDEFLKRGVITAEKIKENTAWGTNEFGFYDLNNNSIFFVQDVH